MRRYLLAVLFALVSSSAMAAQIRVCADASCEYDNSELQLALNAAVGGDEILLQEDFVYQDCYEMPYHAGASYVIVRTGVSATGAILATNPGNFPTATQQMNPTRADTANLAKIQCNLSGSSSPALSVKRSSTAGQGLLPAPGYWHLKWLDLTNTTYSGPILELGYGTTTPTLEHQPHHFIIEQMYIHGDQYRGAFRGVSALARDVTFKLNWVSDIWHRTGYEGQALNITSPASNWTIEDNYISCGTECVMLGGTAGSANRDVTINDAGRTTTGFTVSNHADLFVGRGIAVYVGGANKHTVVTSCGTSVAGAACTSPNITVSPALEAVPDSPGRARWGHLIQNVTFRRNILSRPLWQRDAILPVQAAPSVTKSETGGTLSGTVCYLTTQRRSAYGTFTSAKSPETCVTFTGTTGSATVSWSAGTQINEYYVYRGPSGSPNQRFAVSGSQLSFLDTGAAGVTENPPTTGTTTSVKNLFEIKNGTDVVVEGNLMENNWSQAQLGVAVLFTPAPSSASNPSTEIANLTFRHNVIRRATAGFQLLGRSQSCQYPSKRTRDILIHNNLWYDLGPHYGTLRFFAYIASAQVSDTDCSLPYGPLPVSNAEMGVGNLTITHNTIDQTDGQGVFYLNSYTSGAYYPHENVNISDNSMRRAGWGSIVGNFSSLEGNDSWIKHTKGTRTWQNNFTENITPANYPGGATENLTATLAQWLSYHVDTSVGNYRLTGSTPLDNAASDGTDIGVNQDTIESVMGGAPPPPDPVDPPTIPAQTLPNAVIGSTYSYTIIVNDGTQPNSCNLVSGLPANGLTLISSECRITVSGASVTGSAASLSIQVTATDADARTSPTQTLTLGVVAPPAALTITTVSPLPTGTVGVAQTIQFQASGGVAPYSEWGTTDVKLMPPGRTTITTLADGTGENTGVATTPGTYVFTIRVQDSTGTVATKSFTHVINSGAATDCPERVTENRPGEIVTQGAFFVGPTPPTECVKVADHWENTSFSPSVLYKAITPSPSASFVPANVANVSAEFLKSHTDTEEPGEGQVITENSLLYRNENNKWAVLFAPTQNGLMQYDTTNGWFVSSSGAGLTNISTDAITSGIFNHARLGSGGTGGGTRVLHDDGTFKVPTGGTSGWMPLTYALIDHEVDTSPGSSGAYVEVPANNRRRKFIDTQGFATVQMYVQHGDAAATYNVKLQYCSSLAFPSCNTWTDLGTPLTMDPTVFVWSRTSEITLPAGAKGAGTWFRIQMTNTAGASATITLYNVHLVFRP